MAKHVTVVLRCTLAQATEHLVKHLPGAVTKVAGRFVAIQHPDLDEAGVDAAEAICSVHQLPVRNVRLARAI